MRSLPLLCAIGVVLAAPGCSLDEPSVQGARGACGQAEGNLLGCSDAELETPEQACWKLVECGVIPLNHENGGALDWDRCVRVMSSFLDYRQTVSIECIEASSCDQLKTDSSPEDPSLPLCMQFGDT